MMRSDTDRLRRARGFTLMEMMMVILIMALLAGLILGITGLVSRKAAEARAISTMQQIQKALEEYRLKEGSYPTALTAQIQAELTNLNVNLSLADFTDPWGRPYAYTNLGRFQYRLWSWGYDTNVPDARIEYLK